MKFITIMVVTVALSASSARAAWAPKAVADAASAAVRAPQRAQAPLPPGVYRRIIYYSVELYR